MSSRSHGLSPAQRLAPALFIAATTLLAGCQHVPDSLSSLSLMQSSASDAKALTADLPPAAERQWPSTDRDLVDMRSRGHGLAYMPEMQGYLNGLLSRIKQAAGVPEWPGQVYILSSTGLEATASAAGNIYLSQAWLASMESEDEAVALLSHEFAHVYLHYHRIAETVPRFDAAAALLSAGAMIAVGDSGSQWSRVDTAVAAYGVTRDVVSTAWARSQESAADLMGLNLSLRMGYSYDHGYKALLERLATWEERRAQQRKAAASTLTVAIRETAAGTLRRTDLLPTALRTSTFQPLSILSDHIESGVDAGMQNLDDIWGNITSSHPDILSRLDRLSSAVDKLPPESLQYEATTVAWQKAVTQPRTATTLKHYALAARAIENLEDPKAITLAQQSTVGVTSTHALPLHVLYLARTARAGSAAGQAQASDVLSRNIASSRDRAWSSYVDRGQALSRAGRRREAAAVIQQGFAVFQASPQAWPHTIAFVGETEGWNRAKAMAEECKQRFPLDAQTCALAAMSPAEKQQQTGQSKAKIGQMLKKVLMR